MSLSLRDQFPLRLLIGSEDCTHLLADGCTFSNVDPGGFEAASFSIPKDMPSVLRGQYVRLDCGLDVAWEGRVSQIQRSLGAKTTIQCEGYQARFKEENGSMIFVDRDFTRFTDPTYPRQLALSNANTQLGSTQVAAAPGGSPALVQEFSDSWESPYLPVVESWYDAGSQNEISGLYYKLALSTTAAGGSFMESINYSDDGSSTGTESSNLNNSGAGTFGYYALPALARFAVLAHYYTGTPAGTPGAAYDAFWESLAVYGTHGLFGVGADPVGFYPSQIAGWAIGEIPDIQAGVIVVTDASGYIVPHSVYYTPVTLDQILGDMATAAGWHWGVWPSLAPLTGDSRPRVDFRPRPAPGAFTASCRRADCDNLDITEDLSQQFNECVLTFTHVDGTSGVAIVTVDNPILDEAGIPQRVLELQGGTMEQPNAELYALESLALTNVQNRVSGSADIIAAIDSPGGPKAPWMLQSGIDRLRITDLPSTDAFGTMNDLPFTRVEASISSSAWTTSVEFGAGADLVETIQARLTTSTTLAQQG